MAGTTDPFAPAKLGPITLPNRFIKAATFEGMARKNLMTDAIIEFHKAQAAGGIGMTTIAYCAVSSEGQGAPNEIVMRPEAAEGLQKFTDAIHELGTMASIQLGHAGPVGDGAGGKAISASPIFSLQRKGRTLQATEADIERVTNDFVTAAQLAVSTGFDCVELHFGHGYLISNFLSPKRNKRADKWGGSLENRARFARQVAVRVREGVGDAIAVTAKLNLSDGVPGGFWLDECVQVARMLETDGALDALELTGGSSLENAMYFFRGEPPVHEMAQSMPKYMRLPFKIIAKKLMPTYPFEEAFFLEYAREVRAAVDMPLILLGGITQRETVDVAMAEGFDFVAMGRALLREPDLINRWKDGDKSDALCVHCNKCMASIYAGTHCVLVPEGQRPGHAEWADLK